MPRHHFRSRGVDLVQAFEQESILGSYEACFEAVLSCEADVTASYANARGVGYVEICKEEAYHLRVFAYTEECSNDGVVLSPMVSGNDEVTERLARLMANPAHRQVFCAALNVDDVELPPANAYRPLLALRE